jgi:hypothetical protein
MQRDNGTCTASDKSAKLAQQNSVIAKTLRLFLPIGFIRWSSKPSIEIGLPSAKTHRRGGRFWESAAIMRAPRHRLIVHEDYDFAEPIH